MEMLVRISNQRTGTVSDRISDQRTVARRVGYRTESVTREQGLDVGYRTESVTRERGLDVLDIGQD